MKHVLAATVVAFATSSAFAAVSAEQNHGVVHATVSSKVLVEAVPRNMASFSVEVPSPREMIIDKATGDVRTSYIHMMHFLGEVANSAGAPPGRHGPNLRIGGNSADETWYCPNASGVHPPNGDGYVVSDADISAFSHVAGWNGTLSVDLSLRNATDPSNALAYAAAVRQQLLAADIMNFEIGNEPELFTRNGIRQQPFTFTDWENQWEQYASPLTANAGPHMVQGAVFCCGEWDRFIPGYVRNFTTSTRPFLQTISHHFYPMSGADATIAKLLEPHAVDLTGFKALASDCNAHGVPFVIGEGNSAYDGGKEGVSNAFVSALWGVDLLFESAVNGIRRFNFHGGPHGAYTPIDMETNPPYAFARPLFYAMWAFTDAVSNGASVLHVDYDALNSEQMKIWATTHRMAHGLDTVTIVAIPKKLNGGGVDLVLNVSGVANAGANVTVRALKAPAINSTSGVSFGGLTFDGSTTGYPQGVPEVEQHTVDQNGILRLFVHPLHVVVADISMTR
eukprot:CAMPEP_0174844064 /NCGR_PEP_ID=MMETSP1114-20130205/10887_1 /TAXON_ID=312471 /ORGANISM="Neobodo designis, Strain CCAP 1951/1" /LENGTH=507 /DNA_ID=CAMNT_0016078297 /DNA_START=27 /DNA_END=1550 /DNA_ORIENTATION=+